jgi:hypothetical protein
MSQSQANVISEDLDFQVIANFDEPGYQSWIITVLTPGNETSSHDGCNTHYYHVGFTQSIITGSNYSLVILEDETIEAQSNITNYNMIDNVSIVRNIEQHTFSTGMRQFPFYGGDLQKLKLILYYEGSGAGKINLTGVLAESQTLLGCNTTNEVLNTQTFALFTFVMIMIVRLYKGRSIH